MLEQQSSPNKVNILLGIALLAGISLTSAFGYLLFHSLIEIFSVVVACGIFIITWHTRRLSDSNYFLFLGIGFLFVGMITLLHALAYKKMGVFPNQGANLPTQLWVATCYVQILSFTVAPLFFKRKANTGLIFAGFSAITAILLASIFVWDIFPDCFIEGKGLTLFKKTSEYLVALLLIACLVFMRKKREHFASEVYRNLVASLIFLIMAELAFTLYTDVFGITNKLGHILKLVGFFYVYKAIIETGLTKPYDLLFSGLRESEERFRLLAENAQDIIYRYRFLPSPCFEYVSPSATRITSFMPEEFYADSDLLFRICHPEDRPDFRNMYLSPDLFPSEPFRIRWIRKDGKVLWMEQHIKLIFDSEEKLVSLIGIARNVTARKESEEKIELLNTDLALRAIELKTANSELEAFNYSASHDLRAPLANINGCAQVLREIYGNNLEDQAKELLGFIMQETEKMTKLISTLLNFSQLNRKELDRAETDLGAMGSTVSMALKMSQPDRDVKFIIAEDARCIGDPALLRVVMENLVGNAWKYTGKRQSAEIEFGVINSGNGNVFFVRDDGAGFEAEQADDLFKPFHRLHSGEFEGFGIGLATVQRIIQRHGGRIWAEGKTGKGATFYFTVNT